MPNELKRTIKLLAIGLSVMTMLIGCTNNNNNQDPSSSFDTVSLADDMQEPDMTVAKPNRNGEDYMVELDDLDVESKSKSQFEMDSAREILNDINKTDDFKERSKRAVQTIGSLSDILGSEEDDWGGVIPTDEFQNRLCSIVNCSEDQVVQDYLIPNGFEIISTDDKIIYFKEDDGLEIYFEIPEDKYLKEHSTGKGLNLIFEEICDSSEMTPEMEKAKIDSYISIFYDMFDVIHGPYVPNSVKMREDITDNIVKDIPYETVIHTLRLMCDVTVDVRNGYVGESSDATPNVTTCSLRFNNITRIFG